MSASDPLLSWETQLRKGSLALAILGILWNSERYGLEIVDELDAVAGLKIPEGTIYPLLSRLKSDGLVESRWVASTAGHPRKYYKLTRIGRTRVRKMAEAWDSFANGLGALLKPVLRNADRG